MKLKSSWLRNTGLTLSVIGGIGIINLLTRAEEDIIVKRYIILISLVLLGVGSLLFYLNNPNPTKERENK